MDREEILNQLKIGKAVHSTWLQKAKQIIDGFTINESSTPLSSTECKFGIWFYTDGQRLKNIRNNPAQSMTNLEELHYKLHDIYSNIYYIYYGSEKGFFKKKFGKKSNVSKEDKILSQEYYTQMQNTAKDLIQELSRMERRITVINADEIKDI